MSASAFDRLRHEWDPLLDESSQQVYFMRWRWTRLWWQHLAPANSQLRIVTCRDEKGALVGVAPFYLRRRVILGVLSMRELHFLGTGVELKTSEYVDIAARRGYEGAVASAIASALRERDDWDRICFCRVPCDSSMLQEFIAVLAAKLTSRSYDQCPYIDTSGGWGAYKQGLGRSMRRNVDYYARRLFKRYECEFSRVVSGVDVERALDALVHLNTARWESQGEIGSLANPAFEGFLRQAVHHSLAEQRLRLWTLKINGSIEAVLVGFMDNGILHFFQKGHNPSFAKDDLGTAMVALCVRDCCDDAEIRAFDFMGGGAAYKMMWARNIRETTLDEVSRTNVRTIAFDLVRRVSGAATAVFRAIVPMKLRAARREWLKARRFVRRQVTFAGHLVVSMTAGIPGAVQLYAAYAESCLPAVHASLRDSLLVIASTLT